MNSFAGLALHLGTWTSLFTDYHLDIVKRTYTTGKITPTEIIFEQPEPMLIQQTNRYPGETPKIWEYRNFAAGLCFFQEGSFSNGQVQLAPFSAFGVEQGFLVGDTKIRLVQLFDEQGRIGKIVWIREQRNSLGLTTPTPPVAQGLAGTWQGLAYVMKGDSLQPEPLATTTHWHFATETVSRHTTIGSQETDIWEARGDTSVFVGHSYVGYFLPGGGYGLMPLELPQLARDKSFWVEMGWQVNPEQCLRMRRTYNLQGAWENTMLICEQRR